MLPNILMLWSDQPVLSFFVLLFIAMAVLYGARRQAHEFIHALSRTIHNAMRIASRSVMHGKKTCCKEQRGAACCGRGGCSAYYRAGVSQDKFGGSS